MFRVHGREQRRLKFRRPRLQRLSVGHLIPNLLTMGALCAGLSGIRFAFLGRWEMAVTMIIVAGILDGLDGRMARLLNVTSKFGAELDSLADFVSFGVAPAMIIYLWTMDQFGGVGWALTLAYAACCALRLARFNTALGDPNPPSWSRYYFTGVPAPAGAGLVLLPMMLTFEVGPGYFDRPSVNAAALVLVAFLMVSRLPTFSFKQVKIGQNFMLPALLLAGLLTAALVSAPWTTFVCVGAVYLASIPVSIWVQAGQRRKTSAEAAAMPPPALPAGESRASDPAAH
jgi:CDP-diacylglycerol---serine O-phosphatidyltransferase